MFKKLKGMLNADEQQEPDISEQELLETPDFEDDFEDEFDLHFKSNGSKVSEVKEETASVDIAVPSTEDYGMKTIDVNISSNHS